MPAHAAAFDTLTYAKKLEDAGFTSKQAEVQAFALADIVDERLANKEDIRDIKKDIDLKIELLRRDMIIWLGGIVIATGVVLSGVMFALLKMFIPGS